MKIRTRPSVSRVVKRPCELFLESGSELPDGLDDTSDLVSSSSVRLNIEIIISSVRLNIEIDISSVRLNIEVDKHRPFIYGQISSIFQYIRRKISV